MQDLSVGLTLVGLGLGLGAAQPTGAAPRPTKKPKRPTFGCTKRDNTCTGTMPTPCPEAPVGSGGTCVNDNKGKPFCVAGGQCAPCKTNRDCAAVPGAICVKQCPFCQGQGFTSACLVPLTNA
jgi:hypothetical protein